MLLNLLIKSKMSKYKYINFYGSGQSCVLMLHLYTAGKQFQVLSPPGGGGVVPIFSRVPLFLTIFSRWPPQKWPFTLK